MILSEVRAFVADEMLDMAKYLETGFVYGKLELLIDKADAIDAGIAGALIEKPNDEWLLAQSELLSIFRVQLADWCSVDAGSKTAENERLIVLQSLRDEYFEWLHRNQREPPAKEPEDVDGSLIDDEVDERRRDLMKILRACSVDHYNGLYLLGTFDLKKTIYTQQRRACGLVNALAEFGELYPGSKVGIVGGGVGGLTTAVGCALSGADVEVFEEHSELLHYQSGNTQRFLHPNIFDWPAKNSLDEATRLPYLNWDKGVSKDVANQILTAYQNIKDNLQEGSGSILDTCRGEGFRVRNILTANADGRRLEIVGDTPECGGRFDIVVVAVGFGLEKTNLRKFDTPLYWQNDSLDQTLGFTPNNKEKVLISGTGDGALLDVVRGALRKFEHASIETTFEFLMNVDVQNRVKKIEISAENHFEKTGSAAFDFYQRYREVLKDAVDVDGIKAHCQELANPSREITLNYRQTGVFSLGSSPLNRLLVTVLGFSGVVKLQRGNLKEELISKEGNLYSVLWDSAQPPSTYNQLIVRHGPDSEYFKERFPVIWQSIENKQRSIGSLQVTTDLADNLVFPIIREKN